MKINKTQSRDQSKNLEAIDRRITNLESKQKEKADELRAIRKRIALVKAFQSDTEGGRETTFGRWVKKLTATSSSMDGDYFMGLGAEDSNFTHYIPEGTIKVDSIHDDVMDAVSNINGLDQFEYYIPRDSTEMDEDEWNQFSGDESGAIWAQEGYYVKKSASTNGIDDLLAVGNALDVSDVYNISSFDADDYLDFAAERYDDIEGDLDDLEAEQDELDDLYYALHDEYSEASGRRSQRKSARADKRADKKKARKEKRAENKDARAIRKDVRKDTRAENKAIRKEERGARKDIRQDKRAAKKDIRQSELSWKDKRAAKKDVRKESKDRMKSEGGGTFVLRAGKAAMRAHPLTLSMRTAFLSVVNMNVGGIATTLGRIYEAKKENPENYKKILEKWEKFGGTNVQLDSAIAAGMRKKPLFPNLIKGIARKKGAKLGFNGAYSNLTGVEETAIAVGTQVSLAMSIISPILSTVAAIAENAQGKQNPTPADTAAIVAGNEADVIVPAKDLTTLIGDQVAAIKADPSIPENVKKTMITELEGGDDDTILGMPKVAVYIGGGLIAIAGIFGLVKLIGKK